MFKLHFVHTFTVFTDPIIFKWNHCECHFFVVKGLFNCHDILVDGLLSMICNDFGDHLASPGATTTMTKSTCKTNDSPLHIAEGG